MPIGLKWPVESLANRRTRFNWSLNWCRYGYEFSKREGWGVGVGGEWSGWFWNQNRHNVATLTNEFLFSANLKPAIEDTVVSNNDIQQQPNVGEFVLGLFVSFLFLFFVFCFVFCFFTWPGRWRRQRAAVQRRRHRKRGQRRSPRRCNLLRRQLDSNNRPKHNGYLFLWLFFIF